MMPNTAPTRPMSGAEDAIVARLPSPTLKWAESMLWWRRKARSAALIASMSVYCFGAETKAVRPAATTDARWLWLFRPAMVITSSNLPSRSASAASLTKARDCLRPIRRARAGGRR